MLVTQDGRVGGLTTSVAAPWMAGKLTRAACERIMLKNGKERDFVIRSSPHLVRIATVQHYSTRHSVVAERLRDASCLSVVSFNITIPRTRCFIISYIGFRFTTTYN